jgi:hypothetical protein
LLLKKPKFAKKAKKFQKSQIFQKKPKKFQYQNLLLKNPKFSKKAKKNPKKQKFAKICQKNQKKNLHGLLGLLGLSHSVKNQNQKQVIGGTKIGPR